MTSGEIRERSFETFYRTMLPSVRAFATRRAPLDVAEDVVAETFLVAWRRWDEAQAGGLPWLYRTAGYSLANRARSDRRQEQVAFKAGNEQLIETAIHSSHTSIVGAAIARLAAKDRDILLLVYWEGLSLKAVAAVVGCTPGAAAVRLHRARATLRKALSNPAEISCDHRSSRITNEIEVTP